MYFMNQIQIIIHFVYMIMDKELLMKLLKILLHKPNNYLKNLLNLHQINQVLDLGFHNKLLNNYLVIKNFKFYQNMDNLQKYFLDYQLKFKVYQLIQEIIN